MHALTRKALALGLEVDKYVIVGSGTTWAELPDEFWASYVAFFKGNGVQFHNEIQVRD